jgi:NhaB family Na+:H+ antiporter
VPDDRLAELDQFRAFMRGMLMHSAVGAIIGGVTTLVGQPENVIVGVAVGWDFATFFERVAVLSLPAVAAGAVTCVLVERFRLFGYGAPLLPGIYEALEENAKRLKKEMTVQHEATLIAQATVCVCLILALAFHVAEVGLIGLAVIVFASAAGGVTDEHRIGKAFEAGLPFTALLVVFFVIAGMIHHQHLFDPIITWVLGLDGLVQLLWLYFTNGFLSAISDNVFVATVYIDQVMNAFEQGLITREELDDLAATVVIGTGIPAMATPNGQAAFLFLLTSSIAALVRLSYVRMMYMTLPYVVVSSVVVIFFLNFLLA